MQVFTDQSGHCRYDVSCGWSGIVLGGI